MSESTAESLNECRAMVVVGPPGSGKTSLAIREGHRRGGAVFVAATDLLNPLSLGLALRCEPPVVCVEEVNFKNPKQCAAVKEILSGNLLRLQAKYRDPFFIKTPFFIFTSTTIGLARLVSADNELPCRIMVVELTSPRPGHQMAQDLEV